MMCDMCLPVPILRPWPGLTFPQIDESIVTSDKVFFRGARTNSLTEGTTPGARLLVIEVPATATSVDANAQERRLSDCSSATGLRSAGHFVTPLPDQTSSPPRLWEHPRLAVPNYTVCSTPEKGFRTTLPSNVKIRTLAPVFLLVIYLEANK